VAAAIVVLLPGWALSADLTIGLAAEPSSMDPHYHNLTPNNMMATYMSTFTVITKKHGEGAATKDYNSGKAMVGTGPFKFVEWVPGDRIVYTRNDDYRGGEGAMGQSHCQAYIQFIRSGGGAFGR
jgi:ABC-type oligopeptide transport system substrate-binding subunit